MARIRTIKPSFFESEDVAVLPFRARLLWIGLWTHCDDQGRTKDNVKLIKARIWPLDPVSLRDVEDDLETLAARGRIVRYEVDGQGYLEITNWRDHQTINKPSPSKIPAPPPVTEQSRRTTGVLRERPVDNSDSETTEQGKSGQDDSRSPTGVLPERSRGERKGKEGKGRETRARASDPPPALEPPGPKPPTTCQQHRDDPDPPACRRCQTARQAGETWEAERRRRIDTAPKCPHHRGQPAHNCAPCRAERLAAA